MPITKTWIAPDYLNKLTDEECRYVLFALVKDYELWADRADCIASRERYASVLTVIAGLAYEPLCPAELVK
jgi:hypothetical protein